ncbi:MAG: thiamine pyrophosphate-dependent dehydrogenase E1 component subunit alpha, partial [Deltaproteobacteria bacterium]|nr:thiamine pyrophosphate-dependent dehydrogenase E1 component subunit alpha [Deltaproteobacteria bacterium]
MAYEHTPPVLRRTPTISAEAIKPLPPDLLLRMHEIMVMARALEERLIRMQRGGEGHFWIGGPGEEALNTALGLLVKKGRGLNYDYLHLHYRSSATLLAMGADPIDALRQMRNAASDPYSGGRNFVAHYSRREWNVAPVTSPIGVQFVQAIGTAIAQKRARPFHGSEADGITIVQGGDAGTAEGDFASCLFWAARPAFELPILIIVANNGWGISTPEHEVQGGAHIADRAAPFGIRCAVIDGNDPEIAYRVLEEAMDYVRRERKPFLLEAYVSRLYGHSSSSGANYVESEVDCLEEFEKKLINRGLRKREECQALREAANRFFLEASKMVVLEARPPGELIWEHVYA